MIDSTSQRQSRKTTYHAAPSLRGDLGPVDVAEQLPAVGPFEPGGVGQVAVHALHRVGGGVPTQRQVADYKSQDHDPGALVEEPRPGPIEQRDPADAQHHAGHQQRQPQKPRQEGGDGSPKIRKRAP